MANVKEMDAVTLVSLFQDLSMDYILEAKNESSNKSLEEMRKEMSHMFCEIIHRIWKK